MKIKTPEAQILRTPVEIEKLSFWNRSRSGFIMNLEFHGFLDVSTPSVEIMFFSFFIVGCLFDSSNMILCLKPPRCSPVGLSPVGLATCFYANIYVFAKMFFVR